MNKRVRIVVGVGEMNICLEQIAHCIQAVMPISRCYKDCRRMVVEAKRQIRQHLPDSRLGVTVELS